MKEDYDTSDFDEDEEEDEIVQYINEGFIDDE